MTWDYLLSWYGRVVFPNQVGKEKPKLLIWSERSHEYRELKPEHLHFDPRKNEVMVTLDEVHGE